MSWQIIDLRSTLQSQSASYPRRRPNVNRALGRTVALDTPADGAPPLCRECGLDPDEIEALINTMEGRPDRNTKLRLHQQQFEDPEPAELCRPCAVAVAELPRSTLLSETRCSTDWECV